MSYNNIRLSLEYFNDKVWIIFLKKKLGSLSYCCPAGFESPFKSVLNTRFYFQEVFVGSI